MILLALLHAPPPVENVPTANGVLGTIALINIALGVLLPNLVAVITNKLASSRYKAIVLLFLSAITGALTQVITDNEHVQWKTLILSIVLTFITSVTSHYGLLKPIGITGAGGAIQTAIPAGLGAQVAAGGQPNGDPPVAK